MDVPHTSGSELWKIWTNFSQTELCVACFLVTYQQPALATYQDKLLYFYALYFMGASNL
ncbi:hypothetical protein H6G74_08480 [Nostoc spongiaeforme FACHB-130]|uniref:Uncharacterized protein n=1 Tax=Nostoc spongiaeforme FACHB-130 TaxID=1357510 RepID=A0ABR8FSY8_9NOSO|nr:hypothetical protein [Nostoc spongiaeforme]MBD2594366.1 hypothetical protein [Nostoc spongiaeforme FACHB-130]